MIFDEIIGLFLIWLFHRAQTIAFEGLLQKKAIKFDVKGAIYVYIIRGAKIRGAKFKGARILRE